MKHWAAQAVNVHSGNQLRMTLHLGEQVSFSDVGWAEPGGCWWNSWWLLAWCFENKGSGKFWPFLELWKNMKTYDEASFEYWMSEVEPGLKWKNLDWPHKWLRCTKSILANQYVMGRVESAFMPQLIEKSGSSYVESKGWVCDCALKKRFFWKQSHNWWFTTRFPSFNL